ncbi:MAG: hypothetical protein AB1665_00885 [Candidatus Thermoplasmatota archaeon]
MIDDGFKRMRFKPEIIRRAVHMRAGGLSLSRVRDHLLRDGIVVSRWTIHKWKKKYSGDIEKTLPKD